MKMFIFIKEQPMTNKHTVLKLTEKGLILDCIQSKSDNMFRYISNSESSFVLWKKTICHSDLITSGKMTKETQDFSKNILYYLSVDTMNKMNEDLDTVFPTAHQSNIGLDLDFYKTTSIPRLTRRNGPQTTQHNHVLLNKHLEVYLVNETAAYFTKQYTAQIFSNLRKTTPNIRTYLDSIDDVKLKRGEENWYTEIQITEAIHGIGTSEDTDFANIRKSIFLGDNLYLLFEKTNGNERNKLFVLLEKNPTFFSILGLADEKWLNYLETKQKQIENKSSAMEELNAPDGEKNRLMQNQWKQKLAQEMMSYTTNDGEVFCPITNIHADFDDFSMLFIASHIKEHARCKDNKESFDVNNGLLLSANADALFDKHMITIGENKELIFSFLLENEHNLKNQLLLCQPVFRQILNEKRMEYIRFHRQVFEEKENERRNNS